MRTLNLAKEVAYLQNISVDRLDGLYWVLVAAMKKADVKENLRSAKRLKAGTAPGTGSIKGIVLWARNFDADAAGEAARCGIDDPAAADKAAADGKAAEELRLQQIHAIVAGRYAATNRTPKPTSVD